MKNKQWIWTIPIAIIGIIIGIGSIIAIMSLVERWMSPDTYLFYEYQGIAGIAMACLIMIPVILGCLILLAKLQKRSLEEVEYENDVIFIWNRVKRYKGILIAVWGIALYCCVTNVVYVGGNAILVRTPFSVKGTSYEYGEVEQIFTGFGDKIFTLLEYERRGNFYYEIIVDGRSIVFHIPSVNSKIERYEEDTYLELEEFDQRLMELDIEKIGNTLGYENVTLDEKYISRFIRIIEKK